MPKPAVSEELAEEETAEEQVATETEKTSPEVPVAEEVEAEEVSEETKAEDKVTLAQADLEERIAKAADAAVGKAQSAWTQRLQDAAKTDAELKFWKERAATIEKPKTEERDEVAELKASEDFAMMPKRIQEELIAGAEARRQLRQEMQESKKFREESSSARARDRVEMIVDDMKADSENYPGFEGLIPAIRAEAESDPDLLNGLITNPQKWLPRIYKALAAPKATELAEKALDARIKEQVKAKTTKSSARETASKQYKTPKEAYEAAKAQLGITDDRDVEF